jgi:hypothetical protein
LEVCHDTNASKNDQGDDIKEVFTKNPEVVSVFGNRTGTILQAITGEDKSRDDRGVYASCDAGAETEMGFL